jgi:hypothetical protein
MKHATAPELPSIRSSLRASKTYDLVLTLFVISCTSFYSRFPAAISEFCIHFTFVYSALRSQWLLKTADHTPTKKKKTLHIEKCSNATTGSLDPAIRICYAIIFSCARNRCISTSVNTSPARAPAVVGATKFEWKRPILPRKRPCVKLSSTYSSISGSSSINSSSKISSNICTNSTCHHLDDE